MDEKDKNEGKVWNFVLWAVMILVVAYVFVDGLVEKNNVESLDSANKLTAKNVCESYNMTSWGFWRNSPDGLVVDCYYVNGVLAITYSVVVDRIDSKV